MEVILMENIGKLGKVGDIVTVRPGYARNFLFPTQKALRVNAANQAIFESKRDEIEKKNADSQQKAESLAKKLAGIDLTLVRQAGETGRLYGSVSARDIATHISKKFGTTVNSHAVRLTSPLKEIGIFPLSVAPYGDIRVDFRIVVAQSEEEATALLTREKEEAEKAKKKADEDAKKALKAKEEAEKAETETSAAEEANEETKADEAAPVSEEATEKEDSSEKDS